MFYKEIKKKLLVGAISIALLATGCSSQKNANNNVEETFTQEQKVEMDTSKDSQPQTEVSNDVSDDSTIKVENTSSVNNVEMTFFDTGNSDAILIKENDKTMLIDAGDRDDDDLLVRLLKDKGIEKLDYFIVTHPHSDHLGAADAVLKNFTVNRLLVSNGSADTQVYRDFIEAAANMGVNPSVPLEGSKFYLDKSYFEVINTNGGPDTNNYSLVVKYFNGEDKALFMGDAEKEVENKILNQVEPVGLLKAGHHGSHSSSSKAFIDKLGNPMVIIQVGSNNKYGHPHIEPMSLFESKGLEVHRNDTCGSIEVISTGSGFTTDCKKGGYESGDKGSSDKSTVSNNTNNNYSSGSSGSSSNVVSKPSDNKGNVSVDSGNKTQSGIVYYTPNGKSYHTTNSCSTLSRSKKILSGTISESGKNDPCDRCH